ncbi:MAG: response regulator [Chrysiogenetes bacterium]|nr:response regulator [Chrysiogenetes bacterium]
MKKKILIAEDTRLIATAIYDQLSSDFEVTLCFDGKQAASRALEESFDLIVTDIVMPEMDGIELARVLRNQEATKDIPIIALSTKAEDMLNAETRRQFAAYLVKPFGLDELPRIVHDILGGVGAAQ